MRYALMMAAVAATLVGCASTGGPSASESEYDRLSRECQERGGILTPIPGAHGPNEAANYACEHRGTPPRDRN